MIAAGLAEGRLVPPPSRIAATLQELAGTGELWLHTAATATRVVAGFAIGAVSGIVLGGLCG